ncbi:uncharacterized protein LOC108217964 [Daucus carota subsp. sativus]|uniref:uncharacterized protein LOC108217964 n=1 Tax=Daucus carota subsp. sativus TaxID=79200 RepID=UPI0007EF45FD|nr:PREDICTED: uncharacterized protein LOC108217964 [Daucus carota subsp. sativus]
MAITRINLPPLLRAAISHRDATALHPPHIPHHYSHNSATSFLRSHPPNILLSNPHLFSPFLYHRVRPRAAAYPNPLSLSISNQPLVSRSLHTRATVLHKRRRTDNILRYALTFSCIATAGGIILWYKNLQKPRIFTTLNHKLEFRFMGIIPHMYRKGHCVVVEGLARPGAKNVRHNGPWKFFISATEVLDQPHHPTTAFQRNKTILTVKKIYSQDSEIVLAASYRDTNLSGDFFTPADDLFKSEPKMIVFKLDSEYDFKVTQFVFSTFDKFQDVPKLLGEGHSVFIEGFTNLPLGSTDYDNIDKINKMSSDDNWHKMVTGKSKNEKVEYLFIAQVIKKDDERYISREAPTAIRRNTAE